MTTRREPTSQRDDAPLHLVGHRLRKVDAVTRGDRSSANGAQQDAAHASAAPMSNRSAAVLKGSRNKATVLRQVVLVDREIDALRDVAIALRDEYDFHITISGAEALNLLRNGGIDTIVVGQTLYSSTGLNVLAEARRHAPSTHRVLLANAVEAGAIERGAAAVAPFKVLQRPCSVDKLRDLLETSTAAAPPPVNGASIQEPVRIQPLTLRSPSDTHDPADFEHVVMETVAEAPRRKAPSPRREANADAINALPVIVYTDNAEFYQAIVLALQDRHDVRLCTQLERAAEFAELGQCPLLVTDRAATQVELQRISIALRALDAGILTIAAGPPETGAALRKLLGTGALHSFMPKPINAPLVRLAVESAKRQYLQTKLLKHAEPELKATPTVSPFSTRPAVTPHYVPGYRNDFAVDDYEESPWRRIAPKVALAVVLLAGGVAGGWYWWQRNQAPNATPALQSDLQLAKQAYAEGRYSTPSDASALYFYSEALKRAPQDLTAQTGLEQTLERIIEQAEQALMSERLDDAADAIATVRALQPRNKRLPFLEGQLEKERGKRVAARESRGSANSASIASAATPTPEPAVAESRTIGPISNESQRQQAVGRWLTTARQRIAQEKLTSPENDNAEFYLRQAERADPENTNVRQALREVGSRLLSNAREAVSRQQLDTARKRLSEATRFGPDSNAVEQLRQDIDAAASATERGNYLRLALQRTRDNRLFEPERDSAKYYLGQLERIDPGAAETEQAAQALALRLIDNANQAIGQQQLNSAVQLLNETRRLGFTGPELNAADERLRTARNPIAPVAASVAKPVVAAAPRPIKAVAPKFPDEAMRAGVQGWVDVGFRITPSGDVTDVIALASSPSGRFAAQFERAAVAALRQYKYEPRPGDNTAPLSMVQKVQFRLQ